MKRDILCSVSDRYSVEVCVFLVRKRGLAFPEWNRKYWIFCLKFIPEECILLKTDSLADHSNSVWMSSLPGSIDFISVSFKNFSFRRRTFGAYFQHRYRQDVRIWLLQYSFVYVILRYILMIREDTGFHYYHKRYLFLFFEANLLRAGMKVSRFFVFLFCKRLLILCIGSYLIMIIFFRIFFRFP